MRPNVPSSRAEGAGIGVSTHSMGVVPQHDARAGREDELNGVAHEQLLAVSRSEG